MDQLIVLKIGGSLFDASDRLKNLLDQFCSLKAKTLLVHGGGTQATQLARRLGVEPTMHHGRRVTNAQMLDVVTMVYAGLNGKRIAALMQERNCNAMSLSGIDGKPAFSN